MFVRIQSFDPQFLKTYIFHSWISIPWSMTFSGIYFFAALKFKHIYRIYLFFGQYKYTWIIIYFKHSAWPFKGAYWISSNIAIAILNFSLLLPLQLSLFQLCDSKVVALIPVLHFLYKFCRLVHDFFSVLLPIQLSLFQLLRQQQLSFFYALNGVSEE